MTLKTSVIALAALAATTLAQPAEAARFKPKASFDPAEVAFIYDEGNNTITGSTTVRSRMGTMFTCAALDVSLIPHSAFAEERLAWLYGSPERGTNNTLNIPPKFGPKAYERMAAEYQKHMLTTTCQLDGSFTFSELPNGTYYVVSVATWKETPQDSEVSGLTIRWEQPRGLALMQRITVANGETVEVNLLGAE